jgi:UDP-N-acetylglucosamine transferase subunit ALG13
MIFVTVGTNEARFDRLLEALAHVRSGNRIFVQHGPSPIRPAGATCVDYLNYDDMIEAIRGARAVVTHAGVGSVLTCLMYGARPIVVPRLKEFGEAVDDHQLEFGRRVGGAGLVSLVEDMTALPEAIERHQVSPPSPPRPAERLVDDLRGLLAGAVGRAEAAYSM